MQHTLNIVSKTDEKYIIPMCPPHHRVGVRSKSRVSWRSKKSSGGLGRVADALRYRSLYMIIILCQKNMKDWNKCCIRPAVDMQAFPLAKVSVSGEGGGGGGGEDFIKHAPYRPRYIGIFHESALRSTPPSSTSHSLSEDLCFGWPQFMFTVY